MLDTRVKDWTTERGEVSGSYSYRCLLFSFVRFVIAAAAIWLLLFAVQKSFPFVQNGAAAVAQEKQAFARNLDLFAPTDRIRIVAFGNSKTLAGFQPHIFDAAAGPDVSAYNLAIPGDDKFVDLLETALSHGARPTHVFVQTLPRSAQDSNSFWSLLLDNNRIVNFLFPFRNFVRDAMIFAYEARASGGLSEQYNSNALQIEKLRIDRGYYFIKSQSHYPGDRLPEDYTLPTDRPNDVAKRDVNPSDPQFARLMRLAEEFDFQVLLVPVACRRGEFAEPPAVDAEAARRLASFSRAHVVGPAYLLLDLQYFSDPVHLNIRGAEQYSRRLAALFEDWLVSGH